MRGIRKAFPGVLALDGVDFTLRAGEVHALMGENGAGKSTLIKVLTGVYQPDSGSIELSGKTVTPKSPIEAQRLGISTVYQEVNLIPTLSVAENILLGRFPLRGGRIDWRRGHEEARTALARLGVEVDTGTTLSSCSIAIQQLVAIARSLGTASQLLVLDEPTSSLDRDEVRKLFDVIRRLKSEGMGILFVSHFLDQIYEISDRITVLRNGKLVGEYVTPDLPRLKLVEAMLGRSADEIEKVERQAHGRVFGEPLLTATSIARRGVGPIDLEVREGEVVGLAGLLGSGRSETARMLFGLDRPEQGRVTLAGDPKPISGPRDGMQRRVGFLPEDRKTEALIPSLSVRENIVLAMQVRAGWLRKIPRQKQVEVAEQYIKALRIATPSAQTPVGRLSGGNQQKVVLARWLAAQPRVLILDEPTRGVDVGAKAEIENLMGQLCGEGLAIVLIGTDLEEVARDSTRIVVMRDRKKIGELTGEEIEIPRIMQLIAAEPQ
jgi:monosaccharide-transporting ATPase